MNTCRCTRPTDAYVCHQCADYLSRALGDIPALDEELDTSTSSQKGIDYRQLGGTTGGTKPAETPTPVNWAASDARSNLRGVLTAWVRYCHDEKVRNQSPTQAMPEGDPPSLVALSRWLMWRVDGLALLEIGADAVEEITTAVNACQRIIDRPADRQYLGDCRECETGRMFANRDGSRARCNVCGETVDADTLRNAMLAELDDRLCTASEIAHLSTYLGLQAGREQVRKRINQWHKRGRIVSETLFTEPAFQFGIVWRLLVHEDEEKVS